MSADWVEKSLGDILLLQRGHDLPNQSRADGCVPIMGSAGLTGYHNIVKAKGPGVVVGRSGNSMGEVHYTAGDYWPLNTALYVKDFKGNDERFIYYLLKTINFDQFNSGSAQKSLNRNAVHPHRVFIPNSLEEQKRIAKILADLENKIELNRQINQTLEQIAQTIFKSWFVDFEPVKAKIAAKAAGHNPERAAKCAISGKTASELDQLTAQQRQQLAATAALFPDELVESELGLVPEGWKVGNLVNFCALNSKTWKSKTIPPKINYIDLANTKNGEISDIKIFTAEEAPSRARRVLSSGDTIIGTVRPGNRSFALIGAGNIMLTGSTGFAVLSPKTEAFRELVYLIATGNSSIDRLSRLADGAAYPAVRPEVVVAEPCTIPSTEIIQIFHQVAKPIFSQILTNRESTEKLAMIRDILLPKLLSGELSVMRKY